MIAKNLPYTANFRQIVEYCLYETLPNQARNFTAVRGDLLNANLVPIADIDDPNVIKSEDGPIHRRLDYLPITQAMQATAYGHKRVDTPVWHQVLSFQPGEKVDHFDKMRIVDNLMDRFNCNDNQMIAFEHRDKPYQHIHIITNRINVYGKNTAHVEFNYRHMAEFCREQEKQFSLQPSKTIYSLSTGAERIQARPNELRLRTAIDHAINESTTTQEFDTYLNQQGITAKWSAKGIAFVDNENKNSSSGSRLGPRYDRISIEDRLAKDPLRPHNRNRPPSCMDMFMLRMHEAINTADTVAEVLDYLADTYQITQTAHVQPEHPNAPHQFAYRMEFGGQQRYITDERGKYGIATSEELDHLLLQSKQQPLLSPLRIALEIGLMQAHSLDALIDSVETRSEFGVDPQSSGPGSQRLVFFHRQQPAIRIDTRTLGDAYSPDALRQRIQTGINSPEVIPTTAHSNHSPVPESQKDHLRHCIDTVLNRANSMMDVTKRLRETHQIDSFSDAKPDSTGQPMGLTFILHEADQISFVPTRQLGLPYSESNLLARLNAIQKRRLLADAQAAFGRNLTQATSTDDLLSRIQQDSPLQIIRPPQSMLPHDPATSPTRTRVVRPVRRSDSDRPIRLQLFRTGQHFLNIDSYQVHPGFTQIGLDSFFAGQASSRLLPALTTAFHQHLHHATSLTDFQERVNQNTPFTLTVEKNKELSSQPKQLVFTLRPTKQRIPQDELPSGYTEKNLRAFFKGESSPLLARHIDYLTRKAASGVDEAWKLYEPMAANGVTHIVPSQNYDFFRSLKDPLNYWHYQSAGGMKHGYTVQKNDWLHPINSGSLVDQLNRRKAITKLKTSLDEYGRQGLAPDQIGQSLWQTKAIQMQDSFVRQGELLTHEYRFVLPGQLMPVRGSSLGSAYTAQVFRQRSVQLDPAVDAAYLQRLRAGQPLYPLTYNGEGIHDKSLLVEGLLRTREQAGSLEEMLRSIQPATSHSWRLVETVAPKAPASPTKAGLPIKYDPAKTRLEIRASGGTEWADSASLNPLLGYGPLTTHFDRKANLVRMSRPNEPASRPSETPGIKPAESIEPPMAKSLFPGKDVEFHQKLDKMLQQVPDRIRIPSRG